MKSQSAPLRLIVRVVLITAVVQHDFSMSLFLKRFLIMWFRLTYNVFVSFPVVEPVKILPDLWQAFNCNLPGGHLSEDLKFRRKIEDCQQKGSL